MVFRYELLNVSTFYLFRDKTVVLVCWNNDKK